METFESIVVGLGAMGAATTYQLAQRGVKVLGIDQFSPPHVQGSSHGSSRITREAIGENVAYTPLVRRSNAIWKDIESQTEVELLTQCGFLSISSSDEHVFNHVGDFYKSTITAANEFNIVHEELNHDALIEKFPQINIAANEYGYYEPNSGSLNADECVRTQLQLAKDLGATLHLNEKVVEIDEKNHVLRTSAHNEYKYDTLIMSTGPWMPEYMRGIKSDLLTVTRQVLLWFDVGENYESFLPENFPVWIWELQSDRATYGFPALDGPKGGVKLSAECFANVTTPEEIDRTVTAVEIDETYEKYVAPYFHGISNECLRSVTCMYTATPDYQLIASQHPSNDSIYIVSPCSGHGFKHSAGIGEMVAQLITAGTSEVDSAPFSIATYL